MTHPLREAVARAMEPNAFAIYDRGHTVRNGFDNRRFLNAEKIVRRARKKADDAIRAVLTFEPTEGMRSASDLFFANQSFVDVSPAQRKQIYEAMTAALLKEVEDDR